jgi:hypothetical protein
LDKFRAVVVRRRWEKTKRLMRELKQSFKNESNALLALM